MTEQTADQAEKRTRTAEVRDIAATLWFVPPPGRMMIADKLHGLGVRAHPELATLELERSGPVQLGNHAPTVPVSKRAVNEGMEALRLVNPSLAAQIDAAKADADTAARIAAANTVGAQEALARELGIPVVDDVAANYQKIADLMADKPQDGPTT